MFKYLVLSWGSSVSDITSKCFVVFGLSILCSCPNLCLNLCTKQGLWNFPFSVRFLSVLTKHNLLRRYGVPVLTTFCTLEGCSSIFRGKCFGSSFGTRVRAFANLPRFGPEAGYLLHSTEYIRGVYRNLPVEALFIHR
jgi:hypothetical protein